MAEEVVGDAKACEGAAEDDDVVCGHFSLLLSFSYPEGRCAVVVLTLCGSSRVYLKGCMIGIVHWLTQAM